LPYFLDCEASSLSRKSYPVEIAWSDEAGTIESHLINPYLYPKSYTDWDPSSQAIHGLSRNYLSEYGEAPHLVALRLNEALGGRKVFTDAPDIDEFWCRRLFAADIQCEIEFVHMEDLLMKCLPCEYWMTASTGRVEIYSLYQRAREQCGEDAHRAGNDVAYLLQLYQLARQIGEKGEQE
jgi:hypothetical protein